MRLATNWSLKRVLICWNSIEYDSTTSEEEDAAISTQNKEELDSDKPNANKGHAPGTTSGAATAAGKTTDPSLLT
jgi:hypothetical protein